MTNQVVKALMLVSIFLTPVLGLATCLKTEVVNYNQGEFIKQIGCKRFPEGDNFCREKFGTRYLAVKTEGCDLTSDFNFSPEIVREIIAENNNMKCSGENAGAVAQNDFALPPASMSLVETRTTPTSEWKKVICTGEYEDYKDIQLLPVAYSDGKCQLSVYFPYILDNAYSFSFREDGRINIGAFDSKTSSAWHSHGEKYYYISGQKNNELSYRYDDVKKIVQVKLPQGKVITINSQGQIVEELSDVKTELTAMNLTRYQGVQNLGLALKPKGQDYIIESNLVKGDLGDWVQSYTAQLENDQSSIITASKTVKVRNKDLFGAVNRNSEDYFDLTDAGRVKAERLIGR